jgi:transcriptional regulator with XRE-family HTH domain
MTLGDVIKEFRELNNLSMEEFAKMSNLSKSYISMLENNKDPRGNPIRPSIETFDKVATTIGVDLDTLISKVDQDVIVNLKKQKSEDNFDSAELDEDKWRFVQFCYAHASQEDRNRVLTILKVREEWNKYQEVQSFLKG